MKSLRKSILTLLALTLFGGAGAWAQGPTQVTQFTTDMIASWQDGSSDITLADLQALGFVAVDASVAQAWTGAPQNDNALLVYGFNEGNGYIMTMMFNHGNVNPPAQGSISKGDFYSMIAHGEKFFYTGAPNQAIELTKAGANQWSLGQAPDYDLELQVEYYEAHALKNIPAGWTVLVNGVPQQTPYQGDSLMITETDSVTLVPADNPRRVKSVTLEEDAPAAKAAAEATAEDKGKLIGADGNIYDDAAAATAAGTTAVAKIIYIGTTGHATYSHGLALALTDEASTMAWQAAIDACSAKNTSTPVTDATWLLASKDQWNYMLGASGAGSYTALRDGFSGIAGASNLQSNFYWSSTEDDSNNANAWLYRFSNGQWYHDSKGYGDIRVRACLAF